MIIIQFFKYNFNEILKLTISLSCHADEDVRQIDESSVQMPEAATHIPWKFEIWKKSLIRNETYIEIPWEYPVPRSAYTLWSRDGECALGLKNICKLLLAIHFLKCVVFTYLALVRLLLGESCCSEESQKPKCDEETGRENLSCGLEMKQRQWRCDVSYELRLYLRAR